MTKSKAKKAILPTNLGYSRSITPSVGVFKSFNSERPEDKTILQVATTSGVGVFSNYADVSGSGKKSAKEGSDTQQRNEKGGNPFHSESCHLPFEHDSFAFEFTVAFCNQSLVPHSCNERETRSTLIALANGYKNIGGYEYLAELYLNNIFNNAVLWRNKYAEDINVKVTALRTDIAPVTSTASDDYKKLVKVVGEALSGAGKRIVLNVSIEAWIGNGQEVYPSQEFLSFTPKAGEVTKYLAKEKVGDKEAAAMHSQKIGNAIRRIDIWYDNFSNTNKPLPIDPSTVDRECQTVHRPHSGKRDFYSLLIEKLNSFAEDVASNKLKDIDKDTHFFIANLIRGGVFGGKEK